MQLHGIGWAGALAIQSALAFPPHTPLNRRLSFTEDGTFQLAVFSDLHFGEAENLVWGPQQDINSTRVMNTIFDLEKPQLVVLNGDLITGENTYLDNSTDYVNRIVAPLLQRDLLWASTYGNHDSEFNLSRHKILAREQSWPNALTRQDVDTPTSGVSNYYLPVYGHDSSSNVPELLLWFFDSRGGFYYQQSHANGSGVGQPDWVDQTAVDWFTATHSKLCAEYRKDVPSLAFVHIPVNASAAFQASPGVRPHYEPGINDDNPLAQQAQGWCADGSNLASCAYGGQDIPFMKALLATEGLIAVFSGHDHGDDWCFKWDSQLEGMDFAGNGLNLCFDRHSGYGGYGTWTRGSRQVLVTKEGAARREADCWTRLETGDVVGRVTLNSTFGRDYYPIVPDTST